MPEAICLGKKDVFGDIGRIVFDKVEAFGSRIY
jgi:hypothetical protein